MESNSPTTGQDTTSEVSVNRLILIGLCTRILTDSGVQVFFPFLGIIAQGIQTTDVVMGRLVSLRASTGLLSPLFGLLADRQGYRPVMSLGLVSAGLGYLLIAASRSWPLMAVGMVLAGVGTFAFAPNLAAYLSARLPFERRSRGLGIVEYAWAFAGILGLSLIGYLIRAASWRVPFVILGVGLVVIGLLFRRLPTSRHTPEPGPMPAGAGRLAHFLDLGPNRRSAWAVLMAGVFIAMAGFTVILTYGIWLQNEYGLDAANLGQVAFILGLCDITGSGLVSLLGDKIGKRRSVLAGSGLTFGGLLLLPILNFSLVGAVAGLFLARGAFEFTIVSNAILQSEQVPNQRGKVLTLGAAATLLGSTLVGFTSVPLYEAYGMAGVAGSAAAAIFIAFFFILLRARESG